MKRQKQDSIRALRRQLRPCEPSASRPVGRTHPHLGEREGRKKSKSLRRSAAGGASNESSKSLFFAFRELVSLYCEARAPSFRLPPAKTVAPTRRQRGSHTGGAKVPPPPKKKKVGEKIQKNSRARWGHFSTWPVAGIAFRPPRARDFLFTFSFLPLRCRINAEASTGTTLAREP